MGDIAPETVPHSSCPPQVSLYPLLNPGCTTLGFALTYLRSHFTPLDREANHPELGW